MVWRCSITCIVGKGDDPVILDVERYAADARIGLVVAWTEILEQLSTEGVKFDDELQILGHVDRVPTTSDPQHDKSYLAMQRMLDRSKKAEQELHLVRLQAEEQLRLSEVDPAHNSMKGVQNERT